MSDFKGRPLGGVEKLYLALNEIFVKTFAIVAELGSKIPENSIRPALNELSKRHPQLKYRIAEDDQFQFWFISDADSVIPFRIIQIEDKADWPETVAAELTNSFDLSRAPLFRVVVLQKQSNSVLIMLSNHSIGDGMSVSFALRDFLKILSGMKSGTLPVPLSMDESLNEISFPVPDFSPVGLGSLGRRDKNTGASIYINKLQFSEAFTNALADRSRNESTTVNGALNAAVAIAMSKIDGRFSGRPLVTRSPVSARKALNIDDDYALNVITKNLDVNPADHQDFWEFARIITSELNGAPSIEQVRGYVKYFRSRILQPVPFAQIVKGIEATIGTDFMVSNLGRIEEESFGEYRIESLWGPIVISGTGAEQTVGAVTISGKLSLTNISLSEMPALLTETAGVLSAAVR
ncbi:condensation domain-containing protein [Mucilaginibacter rubeus]|uniref:condensation domain-containing protein n=1 Tax=Mucilaginibacter rubeus TaxID=2027860 RepID=UPI00166B589B|nr:condensation domain-containing protein [Mucilaginibacter rubeus]GGA96067.1 peptide synthetase [Mucilaginibacter rubeus]